MTTNEATEKKLEMSDIEYWWNLKIFIRTLLVCGLLLGALLYWVEVSKPPAGYVFERLPPMEGVWGRPDYGVRTSTSTVGGNHVTCSFPSVIYGSSTKDCEFTKIPIGTFVTVTTVRIRVLVPYLNGDADYVQKISANSVVFREKTDPEIAEIWIRGARTDAGRLAVELLIASYLIQILILRKYFWSK